MATENTATAEPENPADDPDTALPALPAHWDVSESLGGSVGIWASGDDTHPICRIPGDRADAREIAEHIAQLHNEALARPAAEA